MPYIEKPSASGGDPLLEVHAGIVIIHSAESRLRPNMCPLVLSPTWLVVFESIERASAVKFSAVICHIV